MFADPLPTIIQGGMGAGVSSWPLARAVSACGQLGVVAGTGLDLILARRLGQGDPDGHVRRALDRFPVPGVAARILARWLVEGGKRADEPFRSKPMPSAEPSPRLVELTVAANFVEVTLAKEGHDHAVGINYLSKIQAPLLPSLFGAMLAGVDVVLMGAGIPLAVPGILDGLAAGRPVELRLDVTGAQDGESFVTRFDPAAFLDGASHPLRRPAFVAIVSSAPLGAVLVRKATGAVDGFVVEGPTAGGHVAPPRGRLRLDATDQPVYGPRDELDVDAMRSLGRPFWLAGSQASPDALVRALELGAAGVQVGTAFAYCEESGLTSELKQRVLTASRQGRAHAVTDPRASPTGFPFKLVPLEGTASDPAVSDARTVTCDLGYLREAYRRPDGALGWRCAAEPLADYVRKGGSEEDARGRRCVCNGLMANVGLGQVRADGSVEPPLVTSGDDVATVARFLRPGAHSYAAEDVVRNLLSGLHAGVR